MRLILLAISIILICLAANEKQAMNGMEELKHALKNYTIITKEYK